MDGFSSVFRPAGHEDVPTSIHVGNMSGLEHEPIISGNGLRCCVGTNWPASTCGRDPVRRTPHRGSAVKVTGLSCRGPVTLPAAHDYERGPRLRLPLLAAFNSSSASSVLVLAYRLIECLAPIRRS